MSDRFANVESGIDDPATHAFAITPDDDADLPAVTRGIYIGGAGDLVVTMLGGGDPVTLVGLAAGIVHPLRVARVHEDSTATDIIGVY
jgi:hypothetical protein